MVDTIIHAVIAIVVFPFLGRVLQEVASRIGLLEVHPIALVICVALVDAVSKVLSMAVGMPCKRHGLC